MENEVLKLILSVEDKSVIKATQEAKRLEKEIKALVATEKVLGKEHEIVKQKTIEIKRKLQDYANISSQKAVPTLKKLIQAERTLSLEVDKNTAALTRNTKATKTAANATNQYGTYAAGAGKKLNTMNMRIQQGGYQLQDLVVQLQSGTSFFTAFGQQGSQFAGIFGPQGAVLGAVIAIGSAIGGMALGLARASENAKTFSDGMSDARSALDEYKNSIDRVKDTDLAQVFGDNTQAIIDMDEASLEFSSNLAKLNLAAGFTDLTSSLDSSRTVMQGLARDSLGLLATFNDIVTLGFFDFREKQQSMFSGESGLKSLGFTEGQLSKFGGSATLPNRLTGIQTQMNTGQFKDAAEGVQQIFDILKGSGDELSASSLVFLNQLKTSVDSALEIQASFNGTAQAAKDAAEAQKQNDKDAKTYAAGEAAMLKILKKRADDRNKAEITFLKIMQDSVNERQKGLDAEQKINDLVDKRRNSMLAQGDLLKHEVFLRTAYKDETYIQERLEQKKLDLYIKQADLNETQAARLRAALNYLVDQKQALKDLNEQESIRLHLQNLQVKAIEESPAGQALRKYGARGTKSDKDPTFGTGSREGKSIYDDPDAGKTFKSTKDEVARLQAVLDLRRQLIGKTQEEAIYLQTLNKLKKANEDADIKMTDTALENAAKRIASDEIEIQKLEDQQQTLQDLASYMGSAYGDALMNIVTDIDFVNDSFEDMAYKTENIFRQMAADIIKELYRVLVVKQMVASVTGFLGFANGGVIQGGKQVQAYANGGVVGGPTYFPMAGGKTGLMGEAGPEAIMPLKRGKGGKLGVEVSGDTGAVNIVQNFSFAANGDESVKKIIAEAAPKIANMTQQQIMDARRRGGQMRSTFG